MRVLRVLVDKMPKDCKDCPLWVQPEDCGQFKRRDTEKGKERYKIPDKRCLLEGV